MPLLRVVKFMLFVCAVLSVRRLRRGIKRPGGAGNADR